MPDLFPVCPRHPLLFAVVFCYTPIRVLTGPSYLSPAYFLKPRLLAWLFFWSFGMAFSSPFHFSLRLCQMQHNCHIQWAMVNSFVALEFYSTFGDISIVLCNFPKFTLNLTLCEWWLYCSSFLLQCISEFLERAPALAGILPIPLAPIVCGLCCLPAHRTGEWEVEAESLIGVYI